jgi:hypothetical protein
MQIFRRFRRIFATPLIAALVFVSMPLGVAQAGLVGSDAVVAAETNQANRDAVTTFMQREDVRSQFQTLGVDPAEAEQRVAALSDAEIAKIAGQLPEDPAGQSALGVVVGAAIIIFVVLLITDILGVTDVFSFVNSH